MNPTDRTRWSLVILALGAGMLAASQTGKVPPVLPLLRAEFGFGLVAAGLVASGFNAAGALFGVLAGTAADRIGRQRALAAGLGLLAMGSLAGALVRDGQMLLATRLAESVGFVLVVVAAPSLIAEASTARDRRLTLSFWGTYMPVGVAVVMAAAPVLVPAIGWRGLWLLSTGLLAAVALLTAATARRPGAPARHHGPKIALKRTLARPGPWLLGFSFTVYSLQWFAVVAWLPTFAIEQMGLSAFEAAIATALVSLVNIVGSIASGFIMGRGAPRWVLLAAVNGGLGLLASGVFSDAAPAFRIGCALAFSAFGGLLPGAVMAGVPVHAASPAELGATNGVIVQCANIGSFTGPPLMAVAVAALGGWQQGRWLLVAVGAVGVGLALLLRRVEARMEPVR